MEGLLTLGLPRSGEDLIRCSLAGERGVDGERTPPRARGPLCGSQIDVPALTVAIGGGWWGGARSLLEALASLRSPSL